MSADGLRAGAAWSFDAAYYDSCYREEIAPGMAPLDHFLAVGLDRGLKPNAIFDPLLRRLADPQLDRDALLRAFVEAGPAPAHEPTIAELAPSIRPLAQFRPPRTTPEDDAENVAAAKSYGDGGAFTVFAGDKTYRVVAPPASALLERLRTDRPFAFARITHGDWDCLYAYEHYRREFRTARPSALTNAELDILALRHCDAVLHHEQIYAENFLFELMRDLGGHSRDADFMHAVAFKGYPTADERLFEWSADGALDDSDVERLKLFSGYFDPDETLYDATVWKRWLISGAIEELPALARAHPVIFLGADRVAELGARWNLPWYERIATPASFGYARRFALLDACRAALDRAKAFSRREGAKRPLFILQGSSFAYWFITRLYATDPDVFYIDFGQALHAWFYDRADIELLNWGRIFGPTIVRNSGLEEYYRDRGFAEPEALFDGRVARSG